MVIVFTGLFVVWLLCCAWYMSREKRHVVGNGEFEMFKYIRFR
jgi:hypothetical protein